MYQEGIGQEVYKEFLGDINAEIDRLTALINDLLMMTRIEAYMEHSLSMQRRSISDITRRAVRFIRPIAERKDITIYYQEKEPVYAECDETRIHQAILNLVENAVKYTGAGGEVFVHVFYRNASAVVAVRDTGEGIGAEHLDHIFDRFYRVDKARSRETGGNGLGLHIVQRIALLHSGNIEVSSKIGTGSIFRLVLPVRHGRPEKEEDGI